MSRAARLAMQVVDTSQQLDTGRPRHPLVGQDEGDLDPGGAHGLQLLQASVAETE